MYKVCPLQFPDISRFREEIKKSRGNAIAYLSTIYYQGRIIVSDLKKKAFRIGVSNQISRIPTL